MINDLASDVAQSGIKYAFGIPGSGSSLQLTDQLLENQVQFITTHFEGSAALMAGTIGRLSDQPGLVLSIKGPGFTNMIPGLTVCSLENFPVVAAIEAYTDDTPTSVAHKRMNHSAIGKELIKTFSRISTTKSTFSDCAACSLAETPGPVVLELIEEGNTANEFPVSHFENCSISSDLLKALDRATKPIIIAGSFAKRSKLANYLEDLKIPIFSTVSAKGLISETGPYAAGIYTGVGLSDTLECQILSKADLVIGIGLRNNEVLAARPFSNQAFNIDYPLLDLHTGFEFAETVSLQNFSEIFERLCSFEWGHSIIDETALQMQSHLQTSEFLPFHVYRAIRHKFNHKVRLVVDTGLFCTIAEHAWTSETPNDFLCAGNSRYMGTGLPMGIASSLHDREFPTVVALGDGGIGMYVAEAKIASQYELPLLILLLSDQGFGSIRKNAITQNLNTGPLLMDNPSWIRTFESFNIPAIQVTNEDEFSQAISNWVPNTGPLFIECVFDPNIYMEMADKLR